MTELTLYDTGVKEDQKFNYTLQSSKSWKNRGNWKKVTSINHSFVGDPLIYNGKYWFFFHSSTSDAPFLYQDHGGIPGELAECNKW